MERATPPGTDLPPNFSVRYWWVTLARGLVVIALGVALLLGADTRGNVATFFAVYWILLGAFTIRWALSDNPGRRPVLALVSGFAGLATGIVVLTRSLFRSLFSVEFAIDLVGVTALLVGVLRISRGFRTEPILDRRWHWDSVVLGAFEIVLGLTLLGGDFAESFLVEAISAWAIVSGLVLILDALQLRRLARKRL